MARIVCSKCGAKAFGKCPGCRTVFPDNQSEAVLSHMLKFRVHDNRTEITYSEWAEDGVTEEEAVARTLKRLYDTLRMMQQRKHGFSFEGYACRHNWVFDEGQVSDIGCHCFT